MGTLGEPKKIRLSLEETISITFEEVKQQICDNYCKYTDGKTADQIEDLWDSDICNNCPLNRL